MVERMGLRREERMSMAGGRGGCEGEEGEG